MSQGVEVRRPGLELLLGELLRFGGEDRQVAGVLPARPPELQGALMVAPELPGQLTQIRHPDAEAALGPNAEAGRLLIALFISQGAQALDDCVNSLRVHLVSFNDILGLDKAVFSSIRPCATSITQSGLDYIK